MDEKTYEKVITTTKTYRTTAAASPRSSLVITRTSGKPSTGGASSSTATRSTTTNRGDASSVAFTEGAYTSLTATGVNQVKTTRDQEKKDMQDLNDRFSDYISKVRNLEAQNRHLADELDKLRSKWGKETTQVKAMYQAELEDARRAIDEAEKEKARLEIRVSTFEDLIEELQAKLTTAVQEVTTNKEKATLQSHQSSDYDQEIHLLRKHLDGLEHEKEKDQKVIDELQGALTRAREDLDQETLAHVDTENQRQTLEEQTEFQKSVHDEEMKEMTVLAYRNSQPESRDFWKHELTQAVNEIRQMYDDKLEALRGQMESNYTVKLQEMRKAATKQNAEKTKSKEDCNDLRTTIKDIRDKINDLEMQNARLGREIAELKRSKEAGEREMEAENTSLRTESNGLRMEMDSITRELQAVMNTKMGLELEISAYRKLLEGEENRMTQKTSSSSRLSRFVAKSASGQREDDQLL